MTERTCDECGVTFLPNHGRNRYCEAHRGRRAAKLREYHDVECVQCGAAFKSARPTGKLCGDACRSDWYRAQGVQPERAVCRLPVDHPVRVLLRERTTILQAKSPLREAVDNADNAAIIAAVRDLCLLDGDCWVWTRRLNDGYPAANIGRRKVAVHRLVLEAKHGKPLGKQAAHHVCANAACVNPEHLQPVTHRENAAEMLARTYMESRIADLEVALASLDPNHPLLHEIGLVS